MSYSNEVEVLLVEDDANDVELALRALKKKNLTNKLHVVRDGADALDFLFARGAYSGRNIKDIPRVVFLDLKLPKVDGMEVLQQMKADERTKVIPVVIMTSSREEQDIVKSYKLGVNSYVVKPLDFEKFAEVVSELGLYWLLINQPPR